MADVAVMPQSNDHGTNFEQQHVQYVYDEIAASMNDTQHKAWPNVKRFLKKFPPGALIADIGCGNGRYLNINKSSFKVGVDVCTALVNNAKSKGYEVAYADNLHLPFRDGIFDGVVSIGVIHHFCSVERRIKAMQELARVLRPGGRVMLYVWALEQKHRKFDSQDVLIPWRGSGRTRPVRTGSSSSFGPSSTSSVSEDESANQSTESSDKQTSQNSPKSLSRHNSLSADDVTSLLELSDFKPNYYSLDFSASPQHKKKEGNSGDAGFVWNKGGIRSGLGNTRTDKVIKECRKLEASLRAMSSGNLDLLDAKCGDEKFALKMDGIRNTFRNQSGIENKNCSVDGLVDETETVVMNGVVDETELGVTLDWAVGDLENDDFEAEIPNPSAIYDSGFIENGLNEQETFNEQDKYRESDNCQSPSKNDKFRTKQRHVEGIKHPKVNPFLKQNSLDPYTFNNVMKGPSYIHHNATDIEEVNEIQEEIQEVSVEFKPPVKGEGTKKSEKSFFSAVKSKLLEIFDDKKDTKNGQKTDQTVISNVATNHVQGGGSLLSEEQLNLATRLNFKVREFPRSSCVDVLNGGQDSPLRNAQSNCNSKLKGKTSVMGTRNQLRENCKGRKDLTGTSKEINNEFSISRHRRHSENGPLNGIYDGYVKIDVDRLCIDNAQSSACVQSSALNNGNMIIRGTKRSQTMDVLSQSSNSDLKETSKKNVFTPTQNSTERTCNTSSETPHSCRSYSRSSSLQQASKESHDSNKISRMNSFPSDRFCPSGKGRNESYEQSERTGFYLKDEDSVFEAEEEPLSSKLYRYYHVFRKGEMETLISSHVTDLHIVQCFYDHANWCIIAEKL